jgi:hypothetical protein
VGAAANGTEVKTEIGEATTGRLRIISDSESDSLPSVTVTEQALRKLAFSSPIPNNYLSFWSLTRIKRKTENTKKKFHIKFLNCPY